VGEGGGVVGGRGRRVGGVEGGVGEVLEKLGVGGRKSDGGEGGAGAVRGKGG